MSLHGDFADAERATDLFVQSPDDHERHDFSLPKTETMRSFRAARMVIGGAKRGAATANGVADRAQEHLIDKRLREKVYGAGLHRANRHRHVAVAADEDDRHVGPVGK